MIKRIFLFLLTNLLILVTISFLLNILGVQPYLTKSGINYESLLIFCLVWGMAGAFISLALSRIMAKMMMGVKVIGPGAPGSGAWVYAKVQELSRKAGLSKMPEVGIYESPEINAFATGPTKNRSLVAVSTGLLSAMNEKEIEGVLAHEIAHIQNGDMVTMTLLQGIVNAFVMFIARIVAFAISQRVDEDKRYFVNMLVVVVLDIILTILGSIVVMWFSRYREFKADAGSAKLAGKDSMIAALEALKKRFQPMEAGHASMKTLKIADGKSWFYLFQSHPPIHARIEALKAATF